MRSQIRFVMSAEDERAFAAQILSDPGIELIDGPRWSSSEPAAHRAFEALTDYYCIVWPRSQVPTLSARPLDNGEWYCDSQAQTLQWLRSRSLPGLLTEGRLAIGSSPELAGAAKLERRYRAWSRWLKAAYRNRQLCWRNPTLPMLPAAPGRSANPGEPDPQVWVGPGALDWLRADLSRRVKAFPAAAVEAVLVE